MKTLIIAFALTVNPFVSPLITFSPPVLQQSAARPKRKTKIDVRYDRQKNITTIQLEELVLWQNPVQFEQIGLVVGFEYPNRIIVTPKSVSVVFRSTTRDWTPFPHNNTLAALLDGVRQDLGKMEGVDFEHRRISISYQDFARIANATKVAWLFGDRKYELTDKQIKSLGDFLELMQREGQEFK